MPHDLQSETLAPVSRPRATRPHDAATLVLFRNDPRGARVLMGRRHANVRFMPNRWVFPGGRLHRDDHSAPTACALRPDVVLALDQSGKRDRGRALALTAIRETWEETGLLLAAPAPAQAARGVWRDFAGSGFLPKLSALTFFARAVTPPARPKRFDTHFFLADAKDLVNTEPSKGCGELEEIAWIPIEDAKRYDLPTPTRWALAEAVAQRNDPARPVLFKRFIKLDPS